MVLKKTSQSGRSMVEMLGVLAIIGVLSIGGIAGYTLSMRRHRVNQVLDAVNKYSLIVYGACQQAIINGDITGFNSCSRAKPYPTFQDAGLGTVADLSTIGVGSTRSNGRTECNLKNVNTTGGDLIRLHIHFNDESLCKTAKGIIGSKDTDSCSTDNPKAVCFEALHQ